MITQAFNQNCIKILTLFSLAPGSRFNRKYVKEKTKMNNVPLDNSLLKLVSSKIIKKEKNYYSINFESEYSKEILDICSKQFKQLKELPLNIYYLLMDLSEYFSIIKGIEVILFGSYAKLAFSVKSDVDISLIHKNSLDKKKIASFVSKMEKAYGKNIEIHYFKKMSFYKNKKDPLIKSILKDGIKII